MFSDVWKHTHSYHLMHSITLCKHPDLNRILDFPSCFYLFVFCILLDNVLHDLRYHYGILRCKKGKGCISNKIWFPTWEESSVHYRPVLYSLGEISFHSFSTYNIQGNWTVLRPWLHQTYTEGEKKILKTSPKYSCVCFYLGSVEIWQYRANIPTRWQFIRAQQQPRLLRKSFAFQFSQSSLFIIVLCLVHFTYLLPAYLLYSCFDDPSLYWKLPNIFLQPWLFSEH